MDNSQEELCTKCQQPLPPGARFCGSCGSVVPAEIKVSTKIENKVTRCTKCNKVLLPAERFCSACEMVVSSSASGTAPDGGSRIGCIIMLVIVVGFIWCNYIAQHRSSNQAASATAAPATNDIPTATPVATPPQNSLPIGSTRGNPKDGATMMWVPAGKFIMGSNSSDNANERPQHEVMLDGFWIYQYEVTVAQYRKFCDKTGRQMPAAPKWGWQEQHPIVYVTWNDATDYAKWAGVTLPTEAQWEKAARGTAGNTYPWGNEWDASKCPKELLSTHPVGSYPQDVSPFGVFDMAGNVREWCQDWYGASYYASSPANNPKGPASGTVRVIHDGSWVDAGIQDKEVYRGSRRDYMPATEQCNFIGFRCAAPE